MNGLVAYSDDEEDRSGAAEQVGQQHDRPTGTDGHEGQETRTAKSQAGPSWQVGASELNDRKVESKQLATKPRPASPTPLDQTSGDDLAWLAPPPKPIRRADGTLAFDTEWGLEPDNVSSDSTTVDPALTAKLAHFHTLKAHGTHFNQSLARNRSFRNPHIYAKLVDWVEVNETASAFESMVRGEADADCVWRASLKGRKEMKLEANADRLAELQKQQQEQADEAKARGRRSNVDFVSSKSNETTFADARALAEQRARKIRQELTARDGGDRGSNSGHRAESGRHGGARRDHDHRKHETAHERERDRSLDLARKRHHRH